MYSTGVSSSCASHTAVLRGSTSMDSKGHPTLKASVLAVCLNPQSTRNELAVMSHRCSRPGAIQRHFWHAWMWWVLSRGVVSPQLATTSSATCVYPMARTLRNCRCNPHLGPHLAAKVHQILLRPHDCQLVGRQIFQASLYHVLGAHTFYHSG